MNAKAVERFFTFRHITIVGLLMITGATGRLTYVPNNNFVLEGATTEFTCCSDIQERFYWKVKSIVSLSIEDIYDSGLVNGFRQTGRFNVTDGNSSGCYRLIITDVKMEDAGTYYCVENEGLGQQSSGWELVIIESFTCREISRESEYMGHNNFGLPQDVISAVCIAKYVGNTSPKPTCKWSNGIQLFNNHQQVTNTNLTATLSIQMPAMKEVNGNQLLCYVDAFSSNTNTPIEWKSPHLRVYYTSFQQKGVQQCSVVELSLECNPPCDYTMLQFSNGSFSCEITYPSKTNKKVYVLLQAKSLEPTTLLPSHVQSSSGNSEVTIAVLVTLLIFFLVAVPAIATLTMLFIRERRKRQSRKMYELSPTGGNSSVGGGTLTRPRVVINMGDGCNMTFGDVHGVQQSAVHDIVSHEKKPFLREVDTDNMSPLSAASISNAENAQMRGVAFLGKHLFFAYRGSSEVKVFRANTLSFKRSWTLHELTELVDITACSEQDCLYISNIKETGIESEIIKVSRDGKLITKWDTERNSGLLSVAKDSNVVMAVYFHQKLIEYEPNGAHVKDIQLQAHLRPIYALKDTSNHYLVSHGCGNDTVHGVLQLDADGNILRAFGKGKGSSTEQMDTPVHIAINEGTIWVADSKNSRVVVLNSSLEYQATLLSRDDELSCPMRICHDQAKRRLLLSDFKNNINFVRVFDIM